MTVSIADGAGALDVTRGERAFVIGIERTGQGNGRSSEAKLDEAVGLAQAIGIDVVAQRTVRLRAPKPATLLGKGQIEEIAQEAKTREAGLLIVDAALTPVQQKSLEEQVGTKVIDRTSLILEIFGERAATSEGRLQVELAHLDYQAGRLVRSWTHLERQRGGFGFLGGPGETQIEADRRLIRERMARIRREPVAPPRPEAARAVAGDCAGRLYQRREIDAFQSHDRRRRARREHAFRDARSHHA
jgi:GTPase